MASNNSGGAIGDGSDLEIVRELLDNVSDAVYVCDSSTFDLYYLNKSAFKFWKCGTDFSGHKCYEFLRNRDDACPWCPLPHVTDSEYIYEKEGIQDPGDYARVICRPIRWNSHPSVAMYIEDRTVEYQSLKYAERTKSELQNIVDSIPTGIGIFDVTGNTVRQEYLNDGYFQMLDATRNERSPYRDDMALGAVHPDDAELIVSEAHASIDENRMFQTSFRLLFGDGTYRWVIIRAGHSPINANTERFYAAYFDIDDLVRTESALESANSKLNDILNGLPAGVVVFRKQDGVVSVENAADAFNRLSGISHDEIYHSDLVTLLQKHADPDDVGPAVNGIREMFETSQEADFEIRVNANDKKIWLRCRARAFVQPDDSQLAYAVFTDVTSRREMEQAEHRRYLMEQSYLDSIADTNLATSRINITKDAIETINGIDSLLHGKSYTEAIDASVSHLLREQDRAGYIDLFSRENLLKAYAQGKNTVSLEYYSMRTNGHPLWVKGTMNLVKQPGDEDVIGFLAVSDINQRKIKEIIAEDVLMKKYDFISFVRGKWNSTVVLSMSDDIDTPPSCDDYQAEIEGYAANYVNPEDRDAFVEFMTIKNVLDILDRTGQCSSSFWFEDKDGPRRKRSEFFYLDRENSLLAYIREDITDQFNLEIQRELELRDAYEAAEEASKAKTEFLNRMSHDMRTPMNGIMGMTRIAREQDNPPKTVDCLDKIDASSSFLLGLVNEILDLAKIESGKLEIVPEPYPVSELLLYLDALIKPQCDEKNIELIVKSKLVDGIIPMAPRLHVNRIYFNLLSNAVKFTPENGTITFDLEQEITTDDKLSVVVTVSDTGIGMTQDFQKHLFEPFTQENRRDASEGRGTGLGLAIAKRLAALMGGSIDVHSVPGNGTTFKVQIFLDYIAESDYIKSKEPAMLSTEALEGKNVLLCEDNPINSEIASHLLESKGISVTIASDGQKGVDIFQSSPDGSFDMILMDVRMPIMDGIEATKTIRSIDSEYARNIPIVAMTANAYDRDVRECFDAGMNGHVSKPYTPEELYIAMDVALAQAPIWK